MALMSKEKGVQSKGGDDRNTEASSKGRELPHRKNRFPPPSSLLRESKTQCVNTDQKKTRQQPQKGADGNDYDK